MTDLAGQIKAEADRLGFALCGITSADPPPHHRQYTQWLAEGRAGEMLYLHRQEPKRGDLQQVLPGAKSVVCVALNYAPEEGTPTPGSSCRPLPRKRERGEEGYELGLPSPIPMGEGWGVGVIARYARFDDYHDTLWARLKRCWRSSRPKAPSRSAVKSIVIPDRSPSETLPCGRVSAGSASIPI